MANGYGGGLDILQVTDFIRNLFKERAANKGLQANPQLVGQEGPAAGPIDPALFNNPYFVQALKERSGLQTAESARGLTRAQTTGLEQATLQDKADVARLGGVSVPAFGAMTTREAVRSEAPVRERQASVAETQAKTEQDKLALLKDQMNNEATAKFVENIMPLASLIGGKDVGGFASALLSTIKSGPFAAVGEVASAKQKEKQKFLEGVLGPGGATAAPGTAAPPAPGNVFQNPQFREASTRFKEANKTAAGFVPQFGGAGAIPSAPIYNYPALENPQQVTGAASNVMNQIQALLAKRGDLPTTPEGERTFAKEQGRLPQLSSDYQTFVEAARALGVQDLAQFEQLMARLAELGMLKAR